MQLFNRITKIALVIATVCSIPISFANSISSTSSSVSSQKPVVNLLCSVSVKNESAGSYQVDVTIGNSGTLASTNWIAILDIPANESLTSAWNAAKIAQDQNTYTFANLSSNGALAQGALTSFSATIAYTASTHGLPKCQVYSGNLNHAPTGDFSARVSGATVQIQSIDLADADGDKLTTALDFGDGKSIKYASAWHTYDAPGVYTITQSINDGKQTTTRKHDITVGIAGKNHAPVAIFSYTGANYNSQVNGSASADIDGNLLAYTWDLGNGPLMTTDVKRESFRSDNPGNLVTLTVFDGELGDTVQEFVWNPGSGGYDFSPTLSFTTSLNNGLLSVDASKSKQADSFTWDFGDGATATGMFASHNYAAPGTYTVTLRATDFFFSASKTTSIVVTDIKINHPPVACFTQTSLPVCLALSCPKASVAVDASCSKDADNDTLKYVWDFGDGTQSEGLTSSHSYTVAGNYNIALTVSDGISSNTVTKKFPDIDIISKPVPCFSVAVNIVASDTLIATASCSKNADGSALTYSWDFGDGTTGSGISVNHKYAASGTYKVTLTVRSANGGFASTTQTFSAVVRKLTHCEFKTVTTWNTGAIAWLRIYNDSTNPVSNWDAQITFAATTKIVGFWNGTVAGSNPYKITSVSWNNSIQPKAFAEVGFQLSTNGQPSTDILPILGGSACQ